jgi:hypothetical protein
MVRCDEPAFTNSAVAKLYYVVENAGILLEVDLPAGIHQRRRVAGDGVGAWIDRGISLYRAVRGPHAEGRIREDSLQECAEGPRASPTGASLAPGTFGSVMNAAAISYDRRRAD